MKTKKVKRVFTSEGVVGIDTLKGNKCKIVIDTDIGDDVDDAFAVALALKTEEIEVLGITTVFKNAALRAKILKQELKAFKKEEIPVYVGADVNLKGTFSTFPYEKIGADGKPIMTAYDDSMKDYEADGNDAAEKLLEIADENAGEVTLVAIGPLTNIATAIKKDPVRFAKFNRIIIMGGCSKNWREWNIMCDPEAADIVLTCGADITLIGNDCTNKCHMREKDEAALKNLKGEEGEFLRKMYASWKAHNTRTSQMHDALIIAELTEHFCEYETRHIFVPLKENVLRGHTLSLCDKNLGAVKMSVSVREQDFMDYLFERLDK